MAVYPLQYVDNEIQASRAFPRGRVAPRPIIQLTLESQGQKLHCFAIIDSGADHCVLPRSFMEPLGLDPLNCPVELAMGVGSNKVATHFANISIEMKGLLKYPAYAGFTAGLNAWGMGLLGQSGFFDKFNLTFKLSEKAFYIEIPGQ